MEPLGELARRAARGVRLAGARVVDHLPRLEVARGLGREAQQERGREREVARRDHADLPLSRETVDLRIVGRVQPARADDDPDAPLDGCDDVRLHRGRVRVVDQHVRRHRVQRLRDRGVACGVGAGDAGDELQVRSRLDRLGDRASGPAGDAGDAHADHQGLTTPGAAQPPALCATNSATAWICSSLS